MAVVLLDAEALSVLAAPEERGEARRRAQATLAAALERNALVRVSAGVLVEVYRGKAREAAIDRVLNQGIDVLPVDRTTARIAAGLLARARLDSRDAIDALVVATAVRLGGALILTSDPDDLRVLAMDHATIEIQALR
ncbi:MAG: PIN domain-containing protein [Acidimicrobiia bacterium]|nr:PIN domain-containing protein [Acidimicrobiia bacterium]